MKKLLICNIGWMEFYEGQTETDKIKGGGEFVKENEFGHEIYNFQDVNGFCYGYVQPNARNKQYHLGKINLKKIGQTTDDLIHDVLVVWVAKSKGVGTVVVGWYKNATVYREQQRFNEEFPDKQKNEVGGYWITAETMNVKLLSIDARTCTLPRRTKGSIGQSNLYYADKAESKIFRNKILDYILNKPITCKKKVNHDHRVKVEKAAIDCVWSYYEKLGYMVNSVEKDNVGWDLEARFVKKDLLIEVKGLSGSEMKCQLTPNEYSNFSSNLTNYRLAIVTEALSNITLNIFRYSPESHAWINEFNKEMRLCIEEKVSSIITVN